MNNVMNRFAALFADAVAFGAGMAANACLSDESEPNPVESIKWGLMAVGILNGLWHLASLRRSSPSTTSTNDNVAEEVRDSCRIS